MGGDPKLDVALLGFILDDVPKIRAEVSEARAAAQRSETSIGHVTAHMTTLHTDFTTFRARAEEKFANAERRLDDLDGEVGDTTQHTIITIEKQREALAKQLEEKTAEERRKRETEEAEKRTDAAKKSDARRGMLYSVLGGIILLLVGSLLTSIYHRIITPPAAASTK